MQHNERQPHLDLLKGFVITLVLVGHAFYFGFSYTRSALFIILQSIDMPIFVFLAGYLASKPFDFSPGGRKRFWRKKVHQLLVPLGFLLPFYSLLYNLPIQHMVFDMYHGGYWFTLVLFEMFVVFWAVAFINHRVNKNQSIGIELLLAGLSILFVAGISRHWQEQMPISYGLLSWGKMDYLYHNFVIGYFIGKYPQWERYFVREEVTALAGVIFILLMHQSYTSGAILHGIPASLAGLTCAYGISYRFRHVRSTPFLRLMSYLGRESRAIYLTHYFFLFSVPWATTLLNETKEAGRASTLEISFALIYVAVLMAITLFVVGIIKRNKILNFLCYGKKNSSSPVLQPYEAFKDLPDSPSQS